MKLLKRKLITLAIMVIIVIVFIIASIIMEYNEKKKYEPIIVDDVYTASSVENK